eukprot:6080741-Ditylum_brightwellii.AAC.1
MAGDPSSGGVITGGLEIQTHSGCNGEPGVERDLRVHIRNPEFAGQIIMVAVGCADTLADVRTKLVGVIVERMFCGNCVFRVGGEIIPRHKERECLA